MKRKLAMIFVAGMALSFSIGCSVFGAETVEQQMEQKYQKRADKLKEQFDMAKVVEVNENTLVVTLAEKPEMPEGEDGERPERPARPEGEEGEDGERPERPARPEGEEGEDGERPERPARPEGEEGEDGERPERPARPEGEEGEDGERPERLGHKGKMMEELNFKEEVVEIALEDVEIYVNRDEQATIAEIEADDIIRIFYEEDGETVQRIFVNKENIE